MITAEHTYMITAELTRDMGVAFFNLLAPELFSLILAHPVYKM